jgi:hypothetical protein
LLFCGAVSENTAAMSDVIPVKRPHNSSSPPSTLPAQTCTFSPSLLHTKSSHSHHFHNHIDSSSTAPLTHSRPRSPNTVPCASTRPFGSHDFFHLTDRTSNHSPPLVRHFSTTIVHAPCLHRSHDPNISTCVAPRLDRHQTRPHSPIRLLPPHQPRIRSQPHPIQPFPRPPSPPWFPYESGRRMSRHPPNGGKPPQSPHPSPMHLAPTRSCPAHSQPRHRPRRRLHASQTRSPAPLVHLRRRQRYESGNARPRQPESPQLMWWRMTRLSPRSLG